MEKAVAKAPTQRHRAIGAAGGNREAEAVGMAVLSAAANLGDGAADWAAVEAAAGWRGGRTESEHAEALDDAGAGVLAHFEGAVPRLVARHAAEVRRQLAQLPAVLDTLRAAADNAAAAATEVADAARAIAAPPTTTVYISTALAGGGVAAAAAGAARGGGDDRSLEMPLGPAALAAIARQVAGVLALDALGKTLLVSNLLAPAGPGPDDDANEDDGAAPPLEERIRDTARQWATGALALMPYGDLATSLPPPAPACPPALRAAWAAASDGAWRFSGSTLEEHLLAKLAPPPPPAVPPPAGGV